MLSAGGVDDLMAMGGWVKLKRKRRRVEGRWQRRDTVKETDD